MENIENKSVAQPNPVTANGNGDDQATQAAVNNYEVEGAEVLSGGKGSRHENNEAIATYIVTLSHDTGRIRICLAATSAAQARRATMSAEGCPEGAIRSVKKAAKQDITRN